MNDSTKIKTLYSVVITLVLINIGVIGFIMLHHAGRPPHPSEAVVRELNFTDEQKKEYDKIKEEHHKALHIIKEENHRLHDAMFSQLKDGQDNSPAADSIINAIADNIKRDELLTYRHMAKLRKICTSEQLKKFDAMVGKAMGRGAPNGPPPPRD